MSNYNQGKQDEETNFIGETRFYDETGNIIESLNYNGKVLVINFPGSGMTFKNKDENEVKEGAKKTCLDTKSLLPQDEESLRQAFVCTAVYENKADKAIKEYNEENNNTHSTKIFERIIQPMIAKGDYNKTLNNLGRVIFRGHCFGTMVIAEIEKLLEAKLKEQFNETQCKELLSAPQALISSPSLQLDKYPKYFQTTAIVNNSDRTITNEEYCGDRLRQDLQEISGFKKDDLVSLNARKIYDRKKLPQVPDIPDIKMSESKKGNVHFYICNRASLPDNYTQLEKRIKNKIGEGNKDDKSYEAKFMKQLKKNIGGHEYFFLPYELKNKFSISFEAAFKKSQTSMRIGEIRKKLNKLAQLQENMTTQVDETGKTGNSSTGEISELRRQTAQKQVEIAKQAIMQRRLLNRKLM